jgi:hypothetical protein
MRRVKGRIEKLEKSLALSGKPKEGLRLIVSEVAKPTNLAKATCTRTLEGDYLREILMLNGGRHGLSDEDLDKFIKTFPIEIAKPGGR